MKKILFLVLLIFSIISLVKGIENALSGNGSQDFQWSPTVLFLDKINPYEYFLNGNTENRIILMQLPVYSHLTYILFIPFAFFDWFTAKLLWCLVNISASIFCIFFLSNRSDIDIYGKFILLFLFLSSTPFRNTLGNGQHSILVLLFFSLLLTEKKKNFFFIGISYFKYSFMPLMAVFLFFKYGIRKVIISFFSHILGWIFFSFYLKENIIYTLIQPLIVAHNNGFAFNLATGDIFTVINFLSSSKIFSYFVVLCIIFILSNVISKKKNLFQILSLLSVGSLLVLPHLIYDYVLLLPALIFFWKNNKNLVSNIGMLIILYFWLGLRLLAIFFDTNLAVFTILNLFLLIVLFCSIYNQSYK
jgi:hypothetical protein